MEPTTDKPKRVHHGRNVKRIREFFGVKQETFAKLLGPDWNQRRVSGLEDKQTIEPELIEQIAKALNVSADAIENITDEVAVNYFNNNFYDRSFNQSGNHCTVNIDPIEELVKSFNDYKALNVKNAQLYEDLLRVEREKIQLLERLLNSK